MTKVKIGTLIIFFITTSFSVCAQFGYKQYQKVNGVIFSYKWGTNMNKEEGEKRPALLIMVKNENEFDVDFSYSLDFYYEGILRESSDSAQYCIKAGKTMIGKLNGIIYPINNFTQEQIDNKDFNFVINDIEVIKSDGCLKAEN
jgi:hypothetical protein